MSRKLRPSLLFLLALPSCLFGQTASTHSSTSSTDLFVGGTFAVHSYAITQDSTGNSVASGWQSALDVRDPFHLPALGVTIDGSGYYGQGAHAYFILIGPELSHRFGRSTVFAHGLVGAAHLNGGSGIFPLMSNVTLAEAAGGGVDTTLTRRFAWRVAGDYLHTNFIAGGQETNQLQLVHNNFRLGAGIVFRF